MIAISTQLLNSDIIKKLPDNYGINKTGGVIRMDHSGWWLQRRRMA